MATTTTDVSFPPSHTTTTTTTREAIISPQIRYDPMYWRSKEGIMKVLVIVFNLIGFICIEVTRFNTRSDAVFFNTVAMAGFWFSLIILVMYLFHIVEKFYKLPWVHIEMVAYAVLAVLYLIASILVATVNVEAFHAAAFFGFACMIIYGYDAFLKYQMYRAGFVAQSVKQSSTVRVQSA